MLVCLQQTILNVHNNSDIMKLDRGEDYGDRQLFMFIVNRFSHLKLNNFSGEFDTV